jgi:hypothetical protein
MALLGAYLFYTAAHERPSWLKRKSAVSVPAVAAAPLAPVVGRSHLDEC